MSNAPKIIHADCIRHLQSGAIAREVALTFCDPPFNQGHFYRRFNDRQDADAYWKWMQDVLDAVRAVTVPGGAIYFMQREKNAGEVLAALAHTGWTLQNLIVWKKMTSAVPCATKFGKHYQVIAFATVGKRPHMFHKLRIAPKMLAHHKQERTNGVFVTDVWDDIRELTSGYFAGQEPLRTADGERLHKEQSPVALLLRILLSSSAVGELVLDPFAGTGTTLTVAAQLNRRAVGVEIDKVNVRAMKERLACPRAADDVARFADYYRHTVGLHEIWGGDVDEQTPLMENRL